MAIELEFGRGGRARVWENGCPGAGFQNADTVSGSLPAKLTDQPPCAVVLEAVLPKGPRVLYGLLGGGVTPAMGSTVLVSVGYSSRQFGVGQPFASSIAMRPEAPVVGLPRGLAEAAFLGIQDAQVRDRPLGASMLTIDCAAHGAFGSSPVVFRALGSVIVSLLGRHPGAEFDFRRILEGWLS